MKRAGITLATTMALFGSIAGAQAQTGPSGSAQRSTYRSCAGIAATDSCEGSDVDPRQAILQDVYAGGIGNFTSANLDIDRPGTDNDAYARSSVSLGALSLPQIRAETRAGADDRMNINAFGFQTFTWTGTEATQFALSATLHIVDSSVSQPDYIRTRADGDTEYAPGSWLPGGAAFTSYVGIWDPSILSGLNTAEELFGKLFLARCRTAGVLAIASLGGNTPAGNLRGGESSSTITTSGCSNGLPNAGTITLQPGQQILTVAALQLPVNRGGFADATHTFTTMLDPTLPESVRANLIEKLVPSIAAVPEPKSWMLMIAGFGLIGGMLRRRRATLRTTVGPAACRI
ncbi:PEPxxWA-CTERM sorting domain-containing protein [Sphingomonas sp. KR1UV-12]|uniref:PEPxxWA-CTERM sorting domain-containing protein n=1 Tax=Sphingomonas aurea TaxID=3063994 RepID=A0ABT9EJS9_9SPHN|nr:PEPxxWA-CTERM sorting domain-containing protein [Sphingomonas sp. KR1UV-12]MDP1027228.1 PEPxxWA-CTERM sorting domain-containing protein [Sphingomonas sp. KR1UV-12]